MDACTKTDTVTDNLCTDTIECYVERALDAIGGKWSFIIIKNLFDGTKRFGALRMALNNIDPRTLTVYLKNLEKQEILTRTVTPSIPPAVHYTLTEKGQSLKNIVDEMQVWGKTWVNMDACRKSATATDTVCTDTIECYVERALDAIGGKWSFMIIKNLFDGTKRFGALRMVLNNIAPRTLIAYLKSLEKQEILTRTVTPSIPPAVHYTLTEKGQSLKNIVDEMQIWGKTWVNGE